MSFDTNATLNGTDGKLWINNIPCATIKTFVLKQKNVFEDIDKSEQLSKSRRLVGIELTGTISKYKIDNVMTGLMEDYKNAKTPEVKLIGKIENKQTGMLQRAAITGVTFDEMDIINFEQKKVTTEEIPFAAEDYYYIDKT